MSIWTDKKHLSTLIHDTNSSFGLMKIYLRQLDSWNKEYAKTASENGLQVDSKPFIIAEYFRTQIKNAMDVIDSFYKTEKEIYEQQKGSGKG